MKTFKSVEALVDAANRGEIRLFGPAVKGNNGVNATTFAIFTGDNGVTAVVRVNRKGEKSHRISVPGSGGGPDGLDKTFLVRDDQLSGWTRLGVSDKSGGGTTSDLEALLAVGDEDSVDTQELV